MNSTNSYCFLFLNNNLLVKKAGGEIIPLLSEIEQSLLNPADGQYIGVLHDLECFAGKLKTSVIPEEFRLINLRELHSLVDYEALSAAYRASHIVSWLSSNKFCGCCSAETTMLSDEMALKCSACGHIFYPRISPAIIVAVTREDKILLARSFRFPPGRYSVIAGFVEPGETLEECVRRELREEVGIEVDNIKYFGSQPWPFPDSLMIGFTADYAGGTIDIDNKEIAAADWFTADSLPNLPAEDSIARNLINDFVRKS